MEEKFNVEEDAKKDVQKAVDSFRERQTNKSFSERHPELGRMVNCQVCGLRHRSYIKCEQKFAADKDGNLMVAAQTTRGVLGADKFAKKRFYPHYSHQRLQLVELTKQLFFKYRAQIEDDEKAMKAARGEAEQILLRKRNEVRRKIRLQRKRSRKINRV